MLHQVEAIGLLSMGIIEHRICAKIMVQYTLLYRLQSILLSHTNIACSEIIARDYHVDLRRTFLLVWELIFNTIPPLHRLAASYATNLLFRITPSTVEVQHIVTPIASDLLLGENITAAPRDNSNFAMTIQTSLWQFKRRCDFRCDFSEFRWCERINACDKVFFDTTKRQNKCTQQI